LFEKGNMLKGEGLFRLAKGFETGILTDFKEKPAVQAEKGPPLGRVNNFQTRPKTPASYFIRR